MLKLVIFLFFLSFSALAQVKFKQYFIPKTLRVDFYETGNSTEKKIVFALVKQDPFWAGSQINLIDTFNYGEYRYLVYDSASSELIFSRGYCTLFQEWKATAEAKKETRSFYETAILPYPVATIKLEIQARNKNVEFETIFTTYINPKSRFINTETPPRYNWYYIQKSGNYNQKVDVVIIPDGYIKDEMKKFREDAKRFTGYLFNSSPFKENKDKFNVCAIEAISEESGTDSPGENIWKNTVVSSNLYTFNLDRYLTISDIKSLRNIAGLVPYDHIIVLVNTATYGGGGIYNFFSVVSSDNVFSEYVNIHEFGHAFAALGDEYYDSDVAVKNFYSPEKEPWEPNLTNLTDFSKKWKDLVSKDVPVPTPANEKYFGKVGVFEGAGYSAKGIYRPSYDCTMKSVSVNNFCPVCKRAIQQMINYYAK